MSALADLFGARIDRARRARGWTIRELADKAGVNQSTTGKITRGEAEPVLGNAVAVAVALGLSLDSLTAPPSCGVCDGMPPAGMTCQCGTKGPEVAG